MKRKFNYLSFVLIIALCIFLVSCNDVGGTVTNIEGADYKLVSKDGISKIVFDDAKKYTMTGSDAHLWSAGELEFDSLAVLKDTVMNGKLSDSNKTTIATSFPKDANGNVLTCDFNNLYCPTVPDDFTIGKVYWGGQEYGFNLKTDHGLFGFSSYYPESSYKNYYKNQYEDLFSRDLITVTGTNQLENGKTETYYTTHVGSFKRVRYSLSEGSKTIIVDKDYTLNIYSDTSDRKTSSTVPSNIIMYCTDENTYCIVNLFKFTEDPTDEWLMQFGLTPYVEK